MKYPVYLALAAFSLTAADWPQFRGPNGGSVSPETGLPTTWSETENLRWKADLPGRGLSCPVVAGGRVYVTASSTYLDKRLHVLCFAAETGKKLWERQLAATGNTLCHPTTCMAAPTPAVSGDRVFALFATGDLACLNPDGDLLWYRSLVGDYPDITNQVGMAASPVVWKDVVLLPMENAGTSFAAALDRATGRNVWKVPRPREINWVTPVVRERDGRAEAVYQTGQDLTAFDAATGKQLWSFTTRRLSSSSSPVLSGDGLLAHGGGVFTLLHGADGPKVGWESSKIQTGYTSALVYNGRAYGVNGAGVLTCLDAATGQQLWQERTRLKGKFWASPVAADGKVYVVDESGTTAVLRAGDKPEVLAVNKVADGKFLATPAIADGALYLRSEQALYCVGKK